MPLSCDYDNFGSPFDDSDADLILRSKPSQPTRQNRHAVVTQFRVHKFFLSKASPVFKRLLSETRHPNTDIELGITRDKYTDLPVLCLPEDRDTLHSLLTFIYPTDVAQPRTLESMMKTCAAAKKYDMPSASAQFRAMPYDTRVAPVRTTQDAFRTFALAFDEGLTDEAFEAALGMLSSPQTIETYSEDLCIASGPALYALWRHRTKALKAIAAGIQECITEVGNLRSWLSGSHTGNNHSSCKIMSLLPQKQFVLFTQNVTENFSNMNLPRFIETMTSRGRYNCRSCGNYLLFDFFRLFSHLEQRINDRIGEASPAFHIEFQIVTHG
ncbi:hypothetical protein BC827DRAFT_852301 [Russula dissimulans]|nr:hypothetical protein BC827DRAFT_852301 [Russula dissimulans]